MVQKESDFFGQRAPGAFVCENLETWRLVPFLFQFSIKAVVAFFLAKFGCNFLIPTRFFGYEESLRMMLIVNGKVYHIFFTRSRSHKKYELRKS